MTTLETITTELQKQKIPETEIAHTLHTASMLALIEAAHSVVNTAAMPTPLYRLSYDDATHTLDFDFLQGRAKVPTPDSLDISMLDISLASLFRANMPLLFEGKTGVGKTYTVEQLMKTILPQDNYRILRLNQNMTNVLQPYTQGHLENGLVVITLRHEELDRIAALFIDEVNRGDTNQVLQLQDGIIRLSSGEKGELGIPIPQYIDGKWIIDPEYKRPLFVVSAQNPPATKDAKYSATRRLDAAQSNRNLQIDTPNAAAEIGASALLLEETNGHHHRFIDAYTHALARHLHIDEATLAGIDSDWGQVYAFTTDPKKTYCPNIGSGIEFLDAMLAMTAPDITAQFDHDKSVVEDWNKLLTSYGVDFTYAGTLDATAVAMEKLRTLVNSFEEEIITRDIVKVKKLADAVSTIRRVKTALDSATPVATYDTTANFITVKDAACGFAILLHDKEDKVETDPVTLVDTVLKEYIGILENFAQKMGYQQPFTADDPNMSVYNLSYQHALFKAAKAGRNKTEAFIKDLGASVAELKRLDRGVEYRKPMIARLVADLTTLAGFANHYHERIEHALSTTTDVAIMRQQFNAVYQDVKVKAATPDIYRTRLTRVLGV